MAPFSINYCGIYNWYYICKLMKRIAIFASGQGTNAEHIIKHFQQTKTAEVALLVCNKGGAEVVLKAMLLNIPVIVLDRAPYYGDAGFINYLKKEKIDLIVLAGFLLLVPPALIKVFADKIINIHPALLPHYGGKGMYGSKVHEAVLAAKETESGITIHLVNEKFDEGKIIFQAKCEVSDADTLETLSAKIQQLHYLHFPNVIEHQLLGLQ